MLCLFAFLLSVDLTGQVAFVENRGQWNAQARYHVQLNGIDAWVTDDGITYDVYSYTPAAPSVREPLANAMQTRTDAMQARPSRTGHVVRMRFEGANGRATAARADQRKGLYNYFTGNDSTKWLTNVPLYTAARINHLYSGIDALLQIQDSTLRYDLVVAPGADVAQVQMSFDGADYVRVSKLGELEIATKSGMIRQRGLRAFQTLKSGKQRDVPCRFQVVDSKTVRFALGDYDKHLALTIDPLVYSTYVGSSGYCTMLGIAVDKQGCVYGVGDVYGAGFPTTTGAYNTVGLDSNEFQSAVFKMSADGKSLVYSSFFPSGTTPNNGYRSRGIAIDADGSVVIAGTTSDASYPTTAGVVKRSHTGYTEGYITKLGPTGSALVWSTFIGGDGTETATAVALDAQGSVYVAGTSGMLSENTTFPTTAGAFMTTYKKVSTSDAFVMKLNSTCTAVIYSTLLGGNSEEILHSMAVDQQGNAYLTGFTASDTFPTSPGAFRTTYSSFFCSGFLCKLNATGTGLVYSTYIGSQTGNTNVYALCIDSSNQAIIVGTTNSTDYPTTLGALKTTLAVGAQNGYVTKFNAAGTGLIYSTLLGGSKLEHLNRVASDPAGNAYVSGYTQSTDFPTTPNAYDRTLGSANNSDACFAILGPTGASLLYSTYIGGTLNDYAQYALALDGKGGVYIGGNTNSTDYPTTTGAYQTTLGTTTPPDPPMNFFVSKFDVCTITLPRARDSAICKGASAAIGGMQATGGVAPYRYEWDPSIGLSSTMIYNPIATPTGTTEYHVSVTDALGCIVRDTIVVTVRPLPVANAGRDTSVCGNTSVTIGHLATGTSPPFGYQWTPATGLSAPTEAVTQAMPLVDTRYILRVIDANGCISFDTVQITVHGAVVADAGLDIDICPGSWANIGGVATGGTGPYTYKWTPTLGLNRTDTATPVARPATTTKYYVTVTDAMGCTGTDSVAVNVANSVSSKITVRGDVPVCAGDSVELDAGAGYSNYRWSTKQTTRAIRVTTAGKYWATFEDAGGCPGKTDTVQIDFSPLPDVQIRGAKVVCSNSALSYSVPLTVGTTYAWGMTGTTGAITSRLDTNYVDIQWGASGIATLSVRVTTANGCSDSSTLTVSVGAGLKPSVSASRSTMLCAGQSVQLDAGSGFTQYLWSTGDTTSSIVVSTPGKYTVSVHDGTGCSGTSDTITVSSKNGPSPTITSSNGDVICADSTTTLSAPSGYTSYLWSTGETTESIDVSSANSYNVTVMDVDSCFGTAAIEIRMHASPLPRISPSGEVVICDGDSVIITAPQGYASYLWNTAATSSSIVAKTAGRYSVEVVDSNGCKGLSDTMSVVVLPRSTQPTITVSGDTLFCSQADTYQWIRNDVDIVGATQQRYVTSADGYYAVRTTEAGTCPSVSDVTTIGTPRVVWFDTVSGRVGERLRLTMHIEPGLTREDAATGYSVYLHVDPSALFPHAALDVAGASSSPSAQSTSMTYGASGTISITRTIDRPLLLDSLLLFLDIEGLVTASPMNPVVLDSVILRTDLPSVGSSSLVSIAGDGLVILSGCEIGRVFGTRARLLGIQPNPVDDATVVRYKASIGAHTTLRLVDMQGQTLRTLALPAGTGDEQHVTFAIDQLAAGLYALQICDIHEVDALQLIITK